MQMVGKEYSSPIRFETRPWGEIKKGYTHFSNGDVLLAKITPCFENGKAGLVCGLPNGVGAGSTEYFVSRPHLDMLNSRYLYAFLKTDKFLKAGAVQMTGSVGHKRVSKDYLLETELPLAPLNEQIRIADKLDAVLVRVDACRDRIPAILKRFRQSVLAVATSGKLTEDWRVSGKGCKKWELCSVGSLINLNPKTDAQNDVCVGFVPMPLMGTSYLEKPEFEKKLWGVVKKGYTHFQDGDVLLAKITPCFENGKAGIMAGLPNGIGAGSTEYFVCRVIDSNKLLPKFLLAFFKTERFMKQGELEMTGSVGHKRVQSNIFRAQKLICLHSQSKPKSSAASNPCSPLPTASKPATPPPAPKSKNSPRPHSPKPFAANWCRKIPMTNRPALCWNALAKMIAMFVNMVCKVFRMKFQKTG